MSNHFVSIAMATCNGEKFLPKQLESLLAQTHQNFEIIICDDASQDKTQDILSTYAKKDDRIKVFLNMVNIGFVKNFEKALSFCNGQYIALADQDDIWEKNKLEILISEIGTNSLIHSDCSIIDDQDNVLSLQWKKDIGDLLDIKSLLFRNVVTGCTILLKKELLKTALPFPENIAYHDWWLAICAAKDKKICYTKKSLTRYRQHSEQNTGIGSNREPSLLRDIYHNVINRLKNTDFHRATVYRKQKQNLHAIKNIDCIREHSLIIDDAMLYFDNYLNNQIHIKTFFLGLKYHKTLYPYKNYLYLKNFLLDIIG